MGRKDGPRLGHRSPVDGNSAFRFSARTIMLTSCCLVGRHQRDAGSGSSGSSRTADAVNVVLVVVGRVVVDDVRDVVEVEPPGRYIGGDQDLDLALSRIARELAYERPGSCPRASPPLGLPGPELDFEPVGAPLGANEDEGQIAISASISTSLSTLPCSSPGSNRWSASSMPCASHRPRGARGRSCRPWPASRHARRALPRRTSSGVRP